MIGKDKERIIITVNKDDKERLQNIANEENRSLSNLVNVIIKEYLKNCDKQATTAKR